MTQHQVIRSLKTGLYIYGVWTEPHGRGSFGVEDPSTGEILTAVADASPEGIEEYLETRYVGLAGAI